MAQKRVLIYGGTGALGATLVNHFKSKNYWVSSIDLRSSEEAHASIVVDINADLSQQLASIDKDLHAVLSDTKVDAILNVAGGWAGGNALSEDLAKNVDLMWKQSVWSSTVTAKLAASYLNENGVVVLPGAAAALGGTPGMIAYGMAKAAVHQLTKSLVDSSSGLPANTFVACLLPVILDTPMNRKWMPKADTSKWTPLEFIANLFEKWILNEERPQNGSLVRLETENNVTKTIIS